MADYTFTRELVGGVYNIDNLARVDGNGAPISLFKEVQTAFPTKTISINSTGAVTTITFVGYILTSGEETTLNNLVSTHKTSVYTGPNIVISTDQPVLIAPNENKYSLSVDNSGTLITQLV